MSGGASFRRLPTDHTGDVHQTIETMPPVSAPGPGGVLRRGTGPGRGADLPQGRRGDPPEELPGLPSARPGGAVLAPLLRAGPEARGRHRPRHRRAADAAPGRPRRPSAGRSADRQRVLAEADLATLRGLVRGRDAPKWDAKDAPAAREFSSDWPLGPPDLVLTMPEPYELEAQGDDEFRVFVLKTDLPTDRWIRAVDFKPGNRKVVHHVLSGVERSNRGKASLDAQDPEAGLHVGPPAAASGPRASTPAGSCRSGRPGTRPSLLPRGGSGYLLCPAGANVLMQMHYLQEREGRDRAPPRSGPLPLREAAPQRDPDRIRLPGDLADPGDGSDGQGPGRPGRRQADRAWMIRWRTSWSSPPAWPEL